ncbi:ATP-binding cassette domain-containing protein [Plantactinospora sp. S1510]|uniref:ATP-binding cassette domain-containing protein n=1 Tax=Plantactinospora alkalitolerans TaxID=2789879 RepID=A0ABS0HAD6_9ACTN|nr:ATP-binding cassette domain-containing protein [Plantactinospora alkalitolerans]MBF9135441.1 ATP-binding cassette domain-containing protein [Plantactinospora alkalitolerans]
MSDPDLAVRAEGLRKRYGDKLALAGLDLTVPAGTVHGLLGPNGAGKTTAVRILGTLLRFDAGRAEVAGFDVARQADQVRLRIGLVGQHAAVDEILSGRQNLAMFGRLYHLPSAVADRRADELLARFGLADTGGKPVGQYSGGMRRRLDLAAGLILAPPVLFLDEPTTGLDPRSRNEVWTAVRALVSAGTTVLLTTQYLEEADQLADQISVIDDGRIVAEGTPDGLKSLLGRDRIDVVLHRADDLPAAAALLGRVTGGPAELDQDNRRVSAPVRDRMAALTEVVRGLDDRGITAEDIALRRPTLDEVFLHLTGTGAGTGTGTDPGAGTDPGVGAGVPTPDPNEREVAL